VNGLLNLLGDNTSVTGRLATTAALIIFAFVVAMVIGWLVGRRADDAYTRYYLRKAVRVLIVVALLIALAVVWRPFAGRIGIILGFATAGLAFAMQEVIGALAGWISILTGGHFRVGDRIQMGGVRGDVLDLSPLRTKILEIGSGQSDNSWVRGRQYTGRVVSISNKAIFSEPVYNSSAAFDYLWEELSIPVPYTNDWQRAEEILREEAQRASSSADARRAMEQVRRRYPVGRAEVEPRVFVRATDNWVELAARFVVPVRNARAVKDEMTRRILDRFAKESITVASTTQNVTVDRPALDE
jgi:small-conductance mechanosensitive channel